MSRVCHLVNNAILSKVIKKLCVVPYFINYLEVFDYPQELHTVDVKITKRDKCFCRSQQGIFHFSEWKLNFWSRLK